MQNDTVGKAKTITRTASDARMEYTLYGPLMRVDFSAILERKNSLPRNFKLRITNDPEKFSPKSDRKDGDKK